MRPSPRVAAGRPSYRTHAGAPCRLGSRQLTNEPGAVAGSRRWRQAARGCEQKGASVCVHEDSYHKLPAQFTQANKQEDERKSRLTQTLNPKNRQTSKRTAAPSTTGARVPGTLAPRRRHRQVERDGGAGGGRGESE
jgi:hypothetical protein